MVAGAEGIDQDDGRPDGQSAQDGQGAETLLAVAAVADQDHRGLQPGRADQQPAGCGRLHAPSTGAVDNRMPVCSGWATLPTGGLGTGPPGCGCGRG